MTPNNNLSTIRYVLDTDTITYQQRGDATVLQRLSQIDPDHVATTVVSMYEQLRGRLARINRKQNDKSLQLAYLLIPTHAYYCKIHVLPFDDNKQIKSATPFILILSPPTTCLTLIIRATRLPPLSSWEIFIGVLWMVFGHNLTFLPFIN